MTRAFHLFCFLLVLSTLAQVDSLLVKKRSILDNWFSSSRSCVKDGEKLTSAEDFCCEGYQLANDTRCIPACNPGCGDGVCISPNRCDCPPNLTLDLSGACVHTCPRACLNGHCLPDGTCECITGFTLSADKKFCQPYCPVPCPLHMNCSAPGQCSCPTGYKPDPEIVGACKPVCEKSCLGGECAAPNTCFCFPGYKLKDGVCQAECKGGCRNGKCILRNICICDPGYTFNTTTGVCDPVCNECENGNCIAPNVCQCYDGYIRRGRICEPHCTDECLNGYCVAPYHCVCMDGYGRDPNGLCLPLHCSTRFTVKECTLYHSEAVQSGVES